MSREPAEVRRGAPRRLGPVAIAREMGIARSSRPNCVRPWVGSMLTSFAGHAVSSS